jgi:hypothetical protein
MVVGHEPRLGQLIAEMTSTRIPPICRGGVVCVEAATLADITVGLGKVAWRWPVGDAGGVDLTEKLTSKMEVSGVLAGLTLATVAVLFAAKPSALQVISALFLTTSMIDYSCRRPSAQPTAPARRSAETGSYTTIWSARGSACSVPDSRPRS